VLEGIRFVRTNCQDFRLTGSKGRVIFTQTCQMCTAEGSHESAQEGQHDLLLPVIIGQTDQVTLGVL
jgi:cytochrome c5